MHVGLIALPLVYKHQDRFLFLLDSIPLGTVIWVLGIVFIRNTIRNIQPPKLEGWNRVIFEVPSNPSHSMILYGSMIL